MSLIPEQRNREAPGESLLARVGSFVGLVVFIGAAMAFNAYVAEHPSVEAPRAQAQFATQRLPASMQGLWLTFAEHSQQARVIFSSLRPSGASHELTVYVMTRGKFPLKFNAGNAWLVSRDRHLYNASAVQPPTPDTPWTQLTYSLPAQADLDSLVWMVRPTPDAGWEVLLRPLTERPPPQGGLPLRDFTARPSRDVAASEATPALSLLEEIQRGGQPQCQWHKQTIGAHSRLLGVFEGPCDSLTLSVSSDAARGLVVGTQRLEMNLHDGSSRPLVAPAGDVDLRAVALDANGTTWALVSQEERVHPGSMSVEDLLHFQLFRRTQSSWDFVAAQTSRRQECGAFWGTTASLGAAINCRVLHAARGRGGCFPASLLRDDCTTASWEGLGGDLVAKLPSDPESLGWVQVPHLGGAFVATLQAGSIDPHLGGPLYLLQDGDLLAVDGFTDPRTPLTVQTHGAYAILGAHPDGGAPHFAIYDVRTGRPLQTLAAPVTAVQFWP